MKVPLAACVTRGCHFPLPCDLERLILRLGPDRQCPP
jgi:hypothetical protein